MNGITEVLHGGSEAFRRANAHLLARVQRHKCDGPQVFGDGGKKRIRQNAAGLNKTEQAFLAYLRERQKDVFVHSLTLRLGNGVRYTPDFVVNYTRALPLDGRPAHQIDAYEVKGFMRDDAAVKLKVAASMCTWIKFHLVTKRKGGGWDIQEILP